MAIKRRGSHPAAPLFALARPVFAWQATDQTGARDGGKTWALGAAPVVASSPYGRALSFTGNTTTALTRTGVSTAAQTRFWFSAVFRWRLSAMGGGSFPQLLGTSTSNNGWRVGGTYSSGSTIDIGIVKGGVASLSIVAAVDNTWYQAVGSNRQDTGEHYLILRPLDVPADWLRTATSNSSVSTGGNGSAGIGIARTDFAGAWAGDIAYAAAGFDWLPETLARQWLTAPKSAIDARRIWVPVSAGGGGNTGTLATTNANDTSAVSGTTTITGTLARTNANDTSAASGTTTVVGTLAKTNANDTSAASGAVGSSGSTGTLATTNANDTAAASGTTTIIGLLARTNANDTATASGVAGAVTGTVAYTNANDTAFASGSGGPVVATAQGGAGRSKRRRQRYEVEIDGEVFDAESVDQALEILQKAKEQAQAVADKAVERAVKARKREPRKVIADAEKALQLPDIKAPAELQDAADAVLQQIRALYEQAAQAIEIETAMRRREAEIDEDDEEVMLLL